MDDKGKAVAVVGGLGIAGLIAYFATRAKAAPPEGPAAAVKITVLDAEGAPVPAHSPVTVDEGESYTVQVAVTNTTTRGGVPWEANLETWVMAAANWTDLIDDRFPQPYLPGQIAYFYSPLVIPVGLGGAIGAITVDVFDPDGNLVGTAIEPLTIRSLAIIYGAIVTIGV